VEAHPPRAARADRNQSVAQGRDEPVRGHRARQDTPHGDQEVISSDQHASEAVEALRDRLSAVASILSSAGDDELASLATAGAGPLLAHLADKVAETRTGSELWLLGAAIAGGYPTASEIKAMRRGLELASPVERTGACLSAVAVTASAVRSPTVRIEVITTALVDVDFCARNLHNTGIQRVVRNTVKHWSRDLATLACWSEDGTGYRRLTATQELLVRDWNSSRGIEHEPESDVLLLPWVTTVLLPEVPAPRLIDRLTAIAWGSGNRVGLIGYDAIPLVSADFVSEDESDRFAHYLTIVKHASVVSGISDTTAREFRAFNSVLSEQGIDGPTVRTLLLPTVAPQAATGGGSAAKVLSKPLVLMVGSIEPRKNQLGVLAAARELWNEGLDFELLFVGGGGALHVNELDAAIRRSRAHGHTVSHGRGISDEALAEAYTNARVVVFPSLQEGYGLPVAEALASGAPVITSNFGSTAEIAATGGCLLVDPRVDADISEALRSVLTDDVLYVRLVAETAQLSSAGWKEYAENLWQQLVEGGE
jgi:glycosyltransferase involved in cell wall biosynthesis